MDTLILKKDRDRSMRQGHPWIFSGGVDQITGNPLPGATLAVRSASGDFLGWAAYSPQSQIRARLWTRQESQKIGRDFFSGRIQQALALRSLVCKPGETSAYRLLHGESDGLPGVVADIYNDVAVLQLLSAGAEFWKEELASCLAEVQGISSVYERSDVDVRRLEGLEERVGLLQGVKIDGPLTIHENGLKFKVDVCNGQKTGFYIDQRFNRSRVGLFSKDKEVLNCFCYTGGFSLYALAGGAKSVLSLDSSADALALAADNLVINELPAERATWMEADVFHALRLFRDQARSFDLIVLDPPKFAPTAAQAERAARGYKDINLLALKLLRPGGILFTFSCSGGISADLFQKIVAGAALDAGVDVEVVEHLEQGPDHPVALSFPEGAYLKGLICYKRGS
jgi:23S rRNA (cytosine1962-C5)-methyltransferase